MNFSFNFSIPNKEEIETVQWLAEINPDYLDGRELWIYQNFCGGEFE